MTAPRASNPNLHAQAGLFTVVRGGVHAVDRFLKLALEKSSRWAEGVARPLMRKISAPQECAPKLLRLLSYQGIEGATMFPGYDGVVRSLRERALCAKGDA